MISDKIRFFTDGGSCKRYHTVETIRTQDVAAHSFGVAWMVELLTSGTATKDLVMAALAHDLAEHQVGDVPSPAKRAMNIHAEFEEYEDSILLHSGFGAYARRLDAHERGILKLADIFDGMLFCIRERALGNRRVEIVYSRYRGYAREALLACICCICHGIAAAVFKEINNQWKGLTNVG